MERREDHRRRRDHRGATDCPLSLPAFPGDLVGVLATLGDDGPHAVPVSALHRAGDDRVLVALAHRRGSLARLRARPAAALCLMGPGFSVTAHGHALVVAEPLPGAEFMAAVELLVDRLEDTLGEHTLLHEGVQWGWRSHEAAERHRGVIAALAALAAGRGAARQPPSSASAR